MKRSEPRGAKVMAGAFILSVACMTLGGIVAYKIVSAIAAIRYRLKDARTKPA